MNISTAELEALEKALPKMSRTEQEEVLALLEEVYKRKNLGKARADLIAFARAVYPNYAVGQHHRWMARLFADIVAGRKKRIIINVAPRHGKLIADDTPVLTANRGWVTHGGLVPGDYVFHPSGKPTKVIAVSGKAPADVRMEFFDGSVVYCHENHEWVFFNMPACAWEQFETRRFFEKAKTRSTPKSVTSKGRALFLLPGNNPREFPAQVLPVHPYVLGAWLGDGSAGKPCVTHSKEDVPYVEKIASLGYAVSTVCTHNTTGVLTTYFSGPRPNVSGALTLGLQALGVYADKHIPEIYQRGSVEQRKELLAGLLDTDGHVDKNGRCRFVSVSEKLVAGVVELVRSFGWRACVVRTEPSLSTSGIQGKRPYYTVSFQPDFALPTALPRKRIQRFPTQRRIGLKSVTRDPQGKVGHCIQVESEDGLYCVGETHIPTHNSELSSYLFPAWFLGQKPDAKVMMVTHTAELSETFGRRIRNLINSEEYRQVFPGTSLAPDSKSAGAWATAQGGQYYAAGVGGAIAGRGADLLVIDDPHALPLDTPIPTPQGFKTVQELRVGDEVYGPDGLPTRVIGKSDIWHDRPLYAVETDDGEVVHCDGGHLWSYHGQTALARAGSIKTATARELAQWDKPNRPCLPRHAAVQYPSRVLPIDPYVLGAWLGDGTATAAKITSHPDDQPFMRAQFERAGYETTDQSDPYNFGVLGLWATLRDLSLLGNKHIPQAYLTASVEQRMALLQGLMDTDGTVTEAGQCSFQNTNRRLVEDVRELLHSLGHKAKLCSYYDNRERHKTRQPDYRLSFKMADAFRMPRKNVRTYTPEDKRRRTFSVRETELRGSVQCITVDRKDGLFLAGRGYVVTHNSEQAVRTNSKTTFEQAWAWYQTGPRQRLQWGGAIILIMTRWSKLDLCGQLLDYAAKNPDADQWEVVEFPAILPSGKALWPEKWPVEELLKTKASMDPRYWAAQYMQAPTGEEGAIVKRTWWREWTDEKPPKCDYVIQSWDTAHETKTTADYSAYGLLGVFWHTDDKGVSRPNVILLDAFKDRMEFPELKTVVLKHYKEKKPDTILVEKKAAGAPLIQEMRQMGVPVIEYNPSRGKVGQSNDKIARLNSVADMFASGMVWAPNTRWAKEVIEEIASFPYGAHDDYVDVVVQALLRIRSGGLVRIPTDYDYDEKDERPRRAKEYY